jgi:hypothetical protein
VSVRDLDVSGIPGTKTGVAIYFIGTTNSNVLIDAVTIKNRANGIFAVNTALSGITLQNSLLSGNSIAFSNNNSGTIANLTFLNNTINKNSSYALSLFNVNGLQAIDNTLEDNAIAMQLTNVK